jgi:uncharacterized membrane-anchored protein
MTIRKSILFRIVLAAVVSGMIGAAELPASPDDGSAAAPGTTEQAFATALRQSVGGPSRVDLGEQAIERLNENYLFVPKEPAARLLTIAHLEVPADFVGILLGPEGMQAPGIVRFVPAGFVDADTAPAWSADDMMASLKDTVERDNAVRSQANLQEREVRRWIQPPRYNPQAHQISWSALVLSKSAPRDSDGEITFNAIGFGREGYVALCIITSVQKAADIGRMADFFLAGLSFRPGKAYGDTTAGDRRVPGGLAGAIGVDRLLKADLGISFWSSDRVFPVAGGIVAAIGALALFLHVQRTMRREARRG